MMLRYWYLLRSSWPRLLDLVYWPTVQMITWGFLQYYITQNAGFFARAGGTFIGAVLLWDILFRGQLGFSISFLEEMWSRNIGNLMMSPLRPVEFISALMVMSIVRLSIGAVPVTLLAIAFFGFNLYGLGFALVAFFFNLMLTSWAIGIFVSGPGSAKRHGRGELRLVDHVFVHAADLRVLPGDDAAGLAAAGGLAAAADLCVRGHARAADRQGVPRRPDGRCAGAQRRVVCRRRVWVPEAPAERPPARLADAVRRISAGPTAIAICTL